MKCSHVCCGYLWGSGLKTMQLFTPLQLESSLQGLHRNNLIPGNSLLFRERLFWFYAFLSVSMGVWTNRGKQLLLAAACLHFATSLVNSALCARLPVSDAPFSSARLSSALFFFLFFRVYSALRFEVNHSPTDILAKNNSAEGPGWRVFTGTLVRWHAAIQPNVRQKTDMFSHTAERERSVCSLIYSILFWPGKASLIHINSIRVNLRQIKL